ncbi:hypothetical protein [Nostoc sp. UHCC 0870]|uniref:hypothetical protein n=1 Tax=Nostoc sp. UHCC 0870 TaxID=2914041 RepID=UPI0030DC5357
MSLTAVATAIANVLWTKAQEKIGENLGDFLWTAPGKLDISKIVLFCDKRTLKRYFDTEA